MKNHGSASENSRERAEQGNADLDRGQEAIRILVQLDCRGRTAFSLLGLLAELAATTGDDGKFGEGKESVAEYQQENSEDLVKQSCVHLRRLPRMCGGSVIRKCRLVSIDYPAKPW